MQGGSAVGVFLSPRGRLVTPSAVAEAFCAAPVKVSAAQKRTSCPLDGWGSQEAHSLHPQGTERASRRACWQARGHHWATPGLPAWTELGLDVEPRFEGASPLPSFVETPEQARGRHASDRQPRSPWPSRALTTYAHTSVPSTKAAALC